VLAGNAYGGYPGLSSEILVSTNFGQRGIVTVSVGFLTSVAVSADGMKMVAVFEGGRWRVDDDLNETWGRLGVLYTRVNTNPNGILLPPRQTGRSWWLWLVAFIFQMIAATLGQKPPIWRLRLRTARIWGFCCLFSLQKHGHRSLQWILRRSLVHVRRFGRPPGHRRMLL